MNRAAAAVLPSLRAWSARLACSSAGSRALAGNFFSTAAARSSWYFFWRAVTSSALGAGGWAPAANGRTSNAARGNSRRTVMVADLGGEVRSDGDEYTGVGRRAKAGEPRRPPHVTLGGSARIPGIGTGPAGTMRGR